MSPIPEPHAVPQALTRQRHPIESILRYGCVLTKGLPSPAFGEPARFTFKWANLAGRHSRSRVTV